MPLESATFISQLTATNPTAGDLKSEGDDHLRLLKSVLQSQFPNLGAAAVTPTAAQINNVTNASLRAGDTYTGTHDFTGATINVPTASATDNDNSAASTAMVQAAILASSGITASLPAQTGNNGRFLTTNGATASWGVPISGLVLLATLTPTAAAAVNALSVFNSTYDDYIIVGDGIGVATDDSLAFRLAVAGTLDTGSNYFTSGGFNGSFTVAATNAIIAPTVFGAGIGCNFWVRVNNANSTTLLKSVVSECVYQNLGTPQYTFRYVANVYTPTNAITGIGFFYTGATNFDATGSIRIYGVSKT